MHEWWCEGWLDLRWRTVGKSVDQHRLQTQVGLLDADPPRTRPHLNSVGPAVEVRGPRTLGGGEVGGATPTTVAAIAVVAVILLLVGLLWLLLLRALLVLLLSWRAFLPTSGGRGRQRLLHDVEDGGGGGSCRQPMNSLLDFLQTYIVEHLLERREGCRVCEDGAEMFEVLVQTAQDIPHENAIGDIDAKVGEGVGEALHLPIVVIDAEVTMNEALEGGVDV
jgi:hypothetical protein